MFLKGGLNITSLRYSENRALGWYWYYQSKAASGVIPFLVMDRNAVQTETGLPQMVYLRDTRRSGVGLGGFRLLTSHFNGHAGEEDKAKESRSVPLGYHFHDTIALGSYPLDTHYGTYFGRFG
jgi:hypothetical protein